MSLTRPWGLVNCHLMVARRSFALGFERAHPLLQGSSVKDVV